MGFTAARELPPGVEQRVLGTLFLLTANEFVTGAAVGGDALIGAALARMYPDAKHHVIVPANRSQIDTWWLRMDSPKWLHLHFMADGTSYMERNAAIVRLSDELVAYPAHREQDPRSRRSGTWQTVRLARAAGLPIRTIVLDRLAGG